MEDDGRVAFGLSLLAVIDRFNEQSVYRQPVAFNQDTMHLFMHAPEHPGILVYVTDLDSPPKMKLYTAYVAHSILPTHVYELSAEDIEQHPPSVLRLAAHDAPHISHGTASAKFREADIEPQDHGHSIDPQQEKVPMEDIPTEVDGDEVEEDAVRCRLCDEAFPRSTLGNHLRRNHKLDIGDKTTCPICRKDTDPHNFSRHFVNHCGSRFRCPYYSRCGYAVPRSDNRDRHARQCQYRPS
ncbi:hypothetical protein IW262DRAFT_1364966 [Armillaria fumosa]|nr:hypothetical protein IW262DRAFT_1364966 [Armillaria fumosa]